MHSDEQALYRRVCDDPADDTVRLIYADWLEEHGEPERAEFIRTQIAIFNMDELGDGVINPHEGHTCCEDPCPCCEAVDKYNRLKEREHQLLMPNRECWLPEAFIGVPIRMEDMADGYHRGFFARLRIPWRGWLKHWRCVCESTPLQEVELLGWPDHDLDGRAHATGYGSVVHCDLRVDPRSYPWPDHVRREYPLNPYDASVSVEIRTEMILACLSLNADWVGITFTLPKTLMSPTHH